MKKIVYILLFGLSNQLLAQNVGIGTATPDASARLDIVDANRGILIPRVALTATNAAAPVTGPATSLLVYNTATAGTAPNNVTPGYYYWNGTQWVRLNNDGDWKLDGNSNGALRYIGTNDNYDFPIRTNGTEKMRVTSGGFVGIGTTTPVTHLHVYGSSGDANNGSFIIGPTTGANLRMGYVTGSRSWIQSHGSLPLYINELGNNTILNLNSGNVGIGTSTPAARLHVLTGNIYGGRFIRATAPSDGTNAGVLETYNESNGTLWHITHRSGDADKLIFWRWNGSWADVLTLTMGQNVGVATTNPQVRLAVNGPGTNVYATDAWIENNLHVQGNESVSGGRGRLRVGTAWNHIGIYAETNSIGTTNSLILGASNGWTRIGPGAGSGQHFRWSNSTLVDDQGGSIELGGSNWVGSGGTGTPYIDWHINDGYTRDYDIRMIGTTDANGPVLRMFSHQGATNYFYFDLDWIGAYDCWADVSAWRYFANAFNSLYNDVYNDLELIENIRPKRVQDPKSKEFVLINDPKTCPDFLVKPTHNNPDAYAVDITRVGSFSLGAIRMLRRETKSEYEALNAKIQRLENMIEQLTGQKLGEIEFSSSLTLYKDMDKMVIMDIRITPQSKITIEGLSGYQIVDQKEGSFTIQLNAPLAVDTPIIYKSSFK